MIMSRLRIADVRNKFFAIYFLMNYLSHITEKSQQYPSSDKNSKFVFPKVLKLWDINVN